MDITQLFDPYNVDTGIYLRMDYWIVAQIAGTSIFLELDVFFLPDGQTHPIKGKFTYPFTAVTGYTKTTQFVPLAKGKLLSAVVSVNLSTVNRGGCWVQLSLTNDPTGATLPFRQLSAGYVTTSRPLFYPQIGSDSPTDGQGFGQQVLVTAPGAGANNWTYAVPLGSIWIVKSVTFDYVTDVNAGTRELMLLLGQSTTVEKAVNATDVAAISTTFKVHFGLAPIVQGNETVIQKGANRPLSLPRIRGNQNIQLRVGGVQAGDQMQNILIEFEELLSL